MGKAAAQVIAIISSAQKETQLTSHLPARPLAGVGRTRLQTQSRERGIMLGMVFHIQLELEPQY